MVDGGGQDGYLRAWECGPGDLAVLCYGCGTLFSSASRRILAGFRGDPWTWGASAIAFTAHYRTRASGSGGP
ncbi:MAG: hypothetical protein ACTSU5_18215 [Promethearchaeota archaeon]